MTLGELFLLAVAGFTAAAVNGVAGGGSMITFPALLATGIPPLTANVSNAVGLTPGYLAAATGYRQQLAERRARLPVVVLDAIIGSALGVVILLAAPATAFEAVVPLLLAAACVLLLLQPVVAKALRARQEASDGPVPVVFHAAVIFGAAYGSYFGGGVGILLLALLGMILHEPFHSLNATKNLISLIANVVASGIFLVLAPINWAAVVVLGVVSVPGATLGVRFAKRVPSAALRLGIASLGLVVAARLALD